MSKKMNISIKQYSIPMLFKIALNIKYGNLTYKCFDLNSERYDEFILFSNTSYSNRWYFILNWNS